MPQILKPLQGSGGSSVFRVSSGESPNLNQMIEAITHDGYVVAQEFLTEAEQGDVRLFVMNGQPLRQGEAYAAFRRVSTGTDFRSNMHVGGKPQPVQVTDDMLGLIEAVRPKLIEDGMFLVGLDIVGAKLMEVNVFSPGRARHLPDALQSQLREMRSSRRWNAGKSPSARTTRPTSTTPAWQPSDPSTPLNAMEPPSDVDRPATALTPWIAGSHPPLWWSRLS